MRVGSLPRCMIVVVVTAAIRPKRVREAGGQEVRSFSTATFCGLEGPGQSKESSLEASHEACLHVTSSSSSQRSKKTATPASARKANSILDSAVLGGKRATTTS
jgi:hypothetical protein